MQKINALETFARFNNLIESQEKFIRKSIPLIASENVTSEAVANALASDFGHRYAEGLVGERVYAGCKYIDKIEGDCAEIMRQLFAPAGYVDVRPISGVTANLAVYSAFSRPGDTMMALPIPSGGHISHGKINFNGTAGAVHGLNVEYSVLDEKEMNIDVDATKKKILELSDFTIHNSCHPLKIFMFGASVLLFPQPVKELADFVHSHTNAIVCYDAAHVAGLIAGKQFQNPMQEGVDVMTMSTHKTFFGPQHGAVVLRDDFLMADTDCTYVSAEDAMRRKLLQNAVFPGTLSNHHLHSVAALALAATEMVEFGESYAKQVIANAKALGQALYELGFNVLCEHKCFTESHQLLVDLTPLKMLGGDAEEFLELTGLLVNRNLLPSDIRNGRSYKNPGGIRIGVSEVTRYGMKQSEMCEIAHLMRKALIRHEKVESVKSGVEALRSQYTDIEYCFK